MDVSAIAFTECRSRFVETTPNNSFVSSVEVAVTRRPTQLRSARNHSYWLHLHLFDVIFQIFFFYFPRNLWSRQTDGRQDAELTPCQWRA